MCPLAYWEGKRSTSALDPSPWRDLSDLDTLTGFKVGAGAQSPESGALGSEEGLRQYVTFEPDHGGWSEYDAMLRFCNHFKYIS